MKKRVARFQEQNIEAAELILKDPERYGGVESLPVIWALQVLCVAKMVTNSHTKDEAAA